MYMEMEPKIIFRFIKSDSQITKAMKKQEIWRQKQLDIYYRSGRPLFTYDKNFIS